VWACSVVTRLRKEEKAAAIKIKREEVEALRRALEKSGHQKQPITTAPMSGGLFGPTDSSSELQHVEKDGHLLNEAPSFQYSTQSYRRLEAPEAIADRSAGRAGTVTLDYGDVDAMKPNGDAHTGDPTDESKQQMLDPPVPRGGLSDQQPQGERRMIFTSRDSSGDLSQLRPPVADTSPPLSSRRSEGGGGRRRRPENGEDLWPPAGGNSPVQGGTVGTGRTGGAVAASVPGREGGTPRAHGSENDARAERAERGSRHSGAGDDVICAPTCPDRGLTSDDNPLHR